MNQEVVTTDTLAILHFLIQIALIIRILLRPHREPASRIAWIVVILVIPVLGIFIYLILGETNIDRHRVDKMHEIIARLPNVNEAPGAGAADLNIDLQQHYGHLFEVGKSVNGFNPVGGNRAQLMEDSNVAIDSMVADIDAAKDHVHLIFYIWLPDNNGCKVVDALKRAAKRGIVCRAMSDSLGSRMMIESKYWQEMENAGVKLAIALPVGNLLLRPLKGRVDLRNHRKIIIIDNKLTYCGSQNCADPEFRIKPRYAPWVDIVIRFEGPIARQNQYLFASDWETETGEDLSDLLRQTMPPVRTGLAAQVIGTGPTIRYSAMPEMFEALMYAARRELVISTPYYVPDESMQSALCASARRGVETTIILPAKNDSWIVGAASRSYYADLISSGVRIFEYEDGLLHTKSLTLDGEVTLIGSANMDRRSFELNYENNILFYDRSLTGEMRQRQESYIKQSKTITNDIVSHWSWRHQLLNNGIAMLGPVL